MVAHKLARSGTLDRKLVGLENRMHKYALNVPHQYSLQSGFNLESDTYHMLNHQLTNV